MHQVRRQHEVDQLKAAMDDAKEQALREKISRKVQRLEEGGHDTTHLLANLQGERSINASNVFVFNQ